MPQTSYTEVMRLFLFRLYISICFTICISAYSGVISVNIIDSSGNGSVDQSWGIESLDSQVDGWINTASANINGLSLSDGTLTTVNSSSIRPNWNSTDASGDSDNYDGSPLRAFIQAYLAAEQEPHITLSNLNENFPDGCSIIVYLGGPSVNLGASVSLTDGTPDDWNKNVDTTYYYKTRWNPDAANPPYGYFGMNSLIQATEIGPLVDSSPASSFPVADYAVFENIMVDTVTITVDGMRNNGAGLSGFQIIGNSSFEPKNIFDDTFGNGSSAWPSYSAEEYNALNRTPWLVDFRYGASAVGGVYEHANLIEFWQTSNASISNAITVSRSFIADPNTAYTLNLSAAINNGDLPRSIPVRVYSGSTQYALDEESFSGIYNLYGNDYTVDYNNFETRTYEFQLENILQVDSNATIEVQLGGSFGGSESWDANSVAINQISLMGVSVIDQSFDLTVYSQGDGSVSPTTFSSSEVTNLALVATANPGWLFTGWSGSISGDYTTASTNLTLDTDLNILATFSLDADSDGATNIQEELYGTDPYDPNDYPMCQLTIVVDPSQAGSVNPLSGLYKINTEVSLEASVNPGWDFAGWNNAERSGGSPTSASVLMSNDIVVTASFVDPLMSSSQVYYVSSMEGNDSNPGTLSEPWKTVSALNSKVFYPGDQILFKRGEIYAGAANLSDKGTPDNPIIIDTYGSGDKPHLIGLNEDASVFELVDAEGIEIRNLHISNSSQIRGENEADSIILGDRHGIYMKPSADAGDLEYFRFINLDFSEIQGGSQSDHYSTGIYGLIDDNDNYYTRFNDLQIQGCTFKNIDGVGAWVKDLCLNLSDQRIRSLDYYPTIGFVFDSNYGTNMYRNLCRVNGTKGALIQYNIMDTTSLGSGFWPFSAEDTLVQYNLFMRTRNDGADSYVCHYDYNCHGTIMQYNVGYDVDGGLIQLIAMSRDNIFFQTDAIARYNIGIDVGFRNNDNAAGILVNGRVDGGQVYNNTILTFDKAQYQGISFKNWGGGEWSSNNQIYNNLFYALGTISTHHDADRGAQQGNVVRDNLYFGNIQPSVADIDAIQTSPRLVNPDLSADFITFLTSKPSWDQLLQELAKRFKVGYGSGAISEGSIIAQNGGLDIFSNSVSSVAFPTIGAHEYVGDNYVDSDSDKIPDVWEVSYGSHLNPLYAADAVADFDNDGIPNLQEFAFFGNPLNDRDIYNSTYQLNLNNSELDIKHVIPMRSDWDKLGLVIETYWASNLTQRVWDTASFSILGTELNGYTQDLHSQTNKINVSSDSDTLFIKTEIK